jgi:hypothetical protein
MPEDYCGDPTLDGSITTSDALFALRASVGASACSPSRCDVNFSGTVTASDALAILRAAVGLPVVLECP